MTRASYPNDIFTKTLQDTNLENTSIGLKLGLIPKTILTKMNTQDRITYDVLISQY